MCTPHVCFADDVSDGLRKHRQLQPPPQTQQQQRRPPKARFLHSCMSLASNLGGYQTSSNGNSSNNISHNNNNHDVSTSPLPKSDKRTYNGYDDDNDIDYDDDATICNDSGIGSDSTSPVSQPRYERNLSFFQQLTRRFGWKTSAARNTKQPAASNGKVKGNNSDDLVFDAANCTDDADDAQSSSTDSFTSATASMHGQQQLHHSGNTNTTPVSAILQQPLRQKHTLPLQQEQEQQQPQQHQQQQAQQQEQQELQVQACEGPSEMKIQNGSPAKEHIAGIDQAGDVSKPQLLQTSGQSPAQQQQQQQQQRPQKRCHNVRITENNNYALSSNIHINRNNNSNNNNFNNNNCNSGLKAAAIKEQKRFGFAQRLHRRSNSSSLRRAFERFTLTSSLSGRSISCNNGATALATQHSQQQQQPHQQQPMPMALHATTASNGMAPIKSVLKCTTLTNGSNIAATATATSINPMELNRKSMRTTMSSASLCSSTSSSTVSSLTKSSSARKQSGVFSGNGNAVNATGDGGKKQTKSKQPPQRHSILRQPVSYTYLKGISGLPTQRVPRNSVCCQYARR